MICPCDIKEKQLSASENEIIEMIEKIIDEKLINNYENIYPISIDITKIIGTIKSTLNIKDNGTFEDYLGKIFDKAIRKYIACWDIEILFNKRLEFRPFCRSFFRKNGRIRYINYYCY